MAKPVLAIVGRPNVGKSTLFNKLIGERRAIVEDVPGITRDRIYGETEWNGRKMIVIDTGGIERNTDDIILSKMRDQAQIAIDTADVILFVCDIRAGLMPDDRDIAVMLKKSGKPIIPCRGQRPCSESRGETFGPVMCGARRVLHIVLGITCRKTPGLLDRVPRFFPLPQQSQPRKEVKFYGSSKGIPP